MGRWGDPATDADLRSKPQTSDSREGNPEVRGLISEVSREVWVVG